MRFVLPFGFGLPLAVGAVVEAGHGNPFAIALVLGSVGPVAFFGTVALLTHGMAPKPLPRKADPAKIARMERELGIEPSKRPTTVVVQPRTPRPQDGCTCDYSGGACSNCMDVEQRMAEAGADKGQVCEARWDPDAPTVSSMPAWP